MLSSFQNKQTYLILALFDILTVLFSFTITFSLRFDVPIMDTGLILLSSQRFWLILSSVILANFIFDLYETRFWVNDLFSPFRILLSTASVFIGTSTLIYFFSDQTKNIIGRGVLIPSLCLLMLSSFIFRFLLQQKNKRKITRSKWMFLGDAEHRVKFREECKNANLKLNDFWLLFDSKDCMKQLNSVLHENRFRGIVLCGTPPVSFIKPLTQARFNGVELFDYINFYEVMLGKVAVDALKPSWFLFSSGFPLLHKRINKAIKSSTDILLALILLTLTSPLMLFLLIFIPLHSKGSPIYRQIRVGLNGKTFEILKLRTMRIDAEEHGAQWAQQDDERVTKIGRLLRFTRIDEIPQLINILRGEMSFIGPRPERPEFTVDLEKNIPFYNFRHLVKPGLTGWAQVMYKYGANEYDAFEKLKYELFYIKNYSYWLDIIIFFKTFVVVLFGKGR